MKCTCEKKDCMTCYQRNWRRKQSIAWKKRQSKRAIEYQKQHSGACKILKKHAEDLKNDPERLSTKFMQKIIGIKCKQEEL